MGARALEQTRICLSGCAAPAKIAQNANMDVGVTSSPIKMVKGPQIVFGFSKTCESDCESIKITFTDGLVTQFLLEWSCNEPLIAVGGRG